MPKKAAGKMIKMTLVRSPIGYPEPQKATVRAWVFTVCIKPWNMRIHRVAWNACQSHPMIQYRRVGTQMKLNDLVPNAGSKEKSQTGWSRYFCRSG